MKYILGMSDTEGKNVGKRNLKGKKIRGWSTKLNKSSLSSCHHRTLTITLLEMTSYDNFINKISNDMEKIEVIWRSKFPYGTSANEIVEINMILLRWLHLMSTDTHLNSSFTQFPNSKLDSANNGLLEISHNCKSLPISLAYLCTTWAFLKLNKVTTWEKGFF